MRLNTFFNQIVDTLLEGVAIEDDGGYLAFANSALEQLLGYEPGELLGLHWTELFVDEPNQFQQGFAARQASGSRRAYPGVLKTKDAGTVAVRLRVQPLFEGGRYWGAISSFVNQGEQVDSHEVLQGAERTAMIGQNVSSVAHELNNLVTIILLQIRLLHRTDPATPQFQERMAALEEQGKRARRTMDNLFTSTAPRQPRLETTDVNQLIRRALDHQAELAQNNGFRIRADLAADLPTVEADPYQLQQVFVNLINNAYQAIEADDGAGALEVSTRLVVDSRGDLQKIVARFSDNGPGISPDIMPHIFRPFFTTKGPGQGMGLGLSVCKEIAQSHQGRIWAENNAAGGATFVLELPVYQFSQQLQPASIRRSPIPIETLVPHSTLFSLNREGTLGR